MFAQAPRNKKRPHEVDGDVEQGNKKIKLDGKKPEVRKPILDDDLECHEDINFEKIFSESKQAEQLRQQKINAVGKLISDNRKFFAASFEAEFTKWVNTNLNVEEREELKLFSKDFLEELDLGCDVRVAQMDEKNMKAAASVDWLCNDPRSCFTQAVMNLSTEGPKLLSDFLSHFKNQKITDFLFEKIQALTQVSQRWYESMKPKTVVVQPVRPPVVPPAVTENKSASNSPQRKKPVARILSISMGSAFGSGKSMPRKLFSDDSGKENVGLNAQLVALKS